MHVPRFSPRISLIEMAPRPALFVTTDREQAPQGTGQSSVPDDDAFPYGWFCSKNIENAFAVERIVTDRRTD
jgi:hypothetical protein